jgi:hypothetical protein
MSLLPTPFSLFLILKILLDCFALPFARCPFPKSKIVDGWHSRCQLLGAIGAVPEGVSH